METEELVGVWLVYGYVVIILVVARVFRPLDYMARIIMGERDPEIYSNMTVNDALDAAGSLIDYETEV